MHDSLRCFHFENPFEAATRRSWALINRISVDHQSRLGARLGREGTEDLDVVICLNRINSAYVEFRRQWLRWKMSGASGASRPDTLRALLDELGGARIGQWHAAIEQFYSDDTPQYAELLPDGGAPFQSGSADERLAAVEALADRLADYSQLAEVRNAVVAFLGELETARGLEHGGGGVLDGVSAEVEFARRKLASALYANLGRLLEKHAEEPERIGDYFDMLLLRTAADPETVQLARIGPIPAAVLAELNLAPAR